MNSSFLKDLWNKSIGSNNLLYKIIGFNVLIFFILALLRVFIAWGLVPGQIQWGLSFLFELPLDLELLLSRPWTIFTYSFAHYDLFHVGFNMLWLYGIGRIFMDFFPQKAFKYVYFGGAVLGAVAFLFILPFFPSLNTGMHYYLIGASASVSAIVIACGVLLRTYRIHLMIIGSISLQTIAIIYLIIQIIGLGTGNPGGALAHLGGALWGAFYALKMQGKLPLWKSIKKPPVVKKSKLKIVYQNQEASKDRQTKTEHVNQDTIDAILDKISKSGYENLTTAEKQLLFRASNQENQKK